MGPLRPYFAVKRLLQKSHYVFANHTGNGESFGPYYQVTYEENITVPSVIHNVIFKSRFYLFLLDSHVQQASGEVLLRTLPGTPWHG